MGKSKVKKALVIAVAVLGMLVEQSGAETFKDCYVKCFIFCMIEPSQTICSCTTRCFKGCIFPGSSQNLTAADNNLNFCNLGCAFFSCAGLSTKHNPNEEEVDNCTSSCSNICSGK